MLNFRLNRFLACATAATLLASCSKAGNSTLTNGEHTWTQPGVLRVAIQFDPKSLNPLLSSDTTDGFVTRLLFEPLLSADPQGNPVPMLAREVPTFQNGGISKDGLTFTYHLRRNARWTDGVPVTSADVAWTWQAIMNPNNNVISRHGYDDIRSIDTPNPHTVVVHLKEKFAPFVNTFFAESDQPYPIVPAHILSKYPNINRIPFNSEPTVSDGPFRFAEWSRGNHITLTRNDGFFMGKPKLKRIDLRIVSDENTSVNLLRTHAIDWIFEASAETYPALKNIPYTRIVWMRINGYYYMQFNNARPFLRDARVRRAIAYAVNKRQLVQTLTYGQDTQASEDIPDWMWAYDPAVRSYPHNIARARALLKAAGWSPGVDGIMRKNAQPLVLVGVTTISNVTFRKESVIVQAQLRQAGIKLELKYVPGDIFYAPAGEGGILTSGKFDVGFERWFAGIDPDDSSQFTCENIPPGGYNYSRFCSRAMDAAENSALTHYDKTTRKSAYARTQALLARDVPAVFLWWTRQEQPISVDFKGFNPNPVQEAWNAWQWSI